MADQLNHVALLKEMFNKVTIEKNVRAIPLYYDKDFKLYTNDLKMNYDEFLKLQDSIFKTPIQFKIRYQEETFIEQGNKVGGRVFITTAMPQEQPREIEVILLAEYKGNKLNRLWELTYPDWSRMDSFQKSVK